MRSKILLSMFMILGLAACAEQESEPGLDPNLDPDTVLEDQSSPLEIAPQEFSCRIVAWTCQSTAQCEAMCGGPGTGICDFRTLCCGCLL